MTFLLNGERVARDDAATIEELITALELSPEATLVEHNGVALRRRDWPNEKLRENDRVEILRIAAGG
jgi:thiamine biosynthesis protein ThiS